MDNSQARLQNDDYQVQAESSGAGNDQKVSALLQVIGSRSALAALVAPNPAGAGCGSVQIIWSPAIIVDVSIYSQAGELVSKANQVSGTLGMNWNLRSPAGQSVSNGVYLIVLRQNGRVMKVIKLAIAR